MDRYVA